MKQAVLDVANELVKEFHGNPYRFLFESDLQGTMFSALRHRIRARIEVPRSDTEPGKPRKSYRVHPVCSEYHSRIDIACLDPAPDHVGEKKKFRTWDVYLYDLPVLVGIELKYLKMGDVWDLLAACYDDNLKLARLKQENSGRGMVRHGMVLGFIQDLDGDKSGFAERRRTLLERKELIPVPSVVNIDGIYVIAQDGVFERKNAVTE